MRRAVVVFMGEFPYSELAGQAAHTGWASATQIVIWAKKEGGAQVMGSLDLLRVGLEAAIASQFALLAIFLLADADRRGAAGFFLASIGGCLVLALLLNALAAAGPGAPLRRLNYFLDLLLGPFALGFAARSARIGPPLRRSDLVHLAGPVVGAFVFLSGWAMGPDLTVFASQASYLSAAVLVANKRRACLAGAGLWRLALALLSAFCVILVLRALVVADVQSLQSYRQSNAYMAILLVVLGLSTFVLWSALRDPKFLVLRPAATRRPASSVASRPVHEALARLIDQEKIYLQPNLTVTDVARQLRVSARQVSELIASQSGSNFSSYINRKRAEAAALALRSSRGLSITTVLFDSGFGSKSAFQREFKRCFGVSPTEYRQQFFPGDDV